MSSERRAVSRDSGKSALRARWLVIGAAAVCVAVTVRAVFMEERRIEDHERARFEEIARATRESIEKRLGHAVRMLEGAQGLFAASKSVERGEWRAYCGSLDLDDVGESIGVEAMRYVANVPSAGLDAFVSAARADGAPGFEIHATESSDDHRIVLYAEPHSRNAGVI